MDNDTLAGIFDEHYPAVYRYLYYRVRHVATAEDFAAQVFRQLLIHVRDGRPPIQAMRPWLFRVAYHLVVDDARRQQIVREELLEENSIAVIDTPLDRLALEGVPEALQKLTEAQQQVITLRYLSDLEYDEIALILNTTVGAVKALQHRAIRQLRQLLTTEAKDIHP